MRARSCAVCGALTDETYCELCFDALVRCDTLGLRDGAIIGTIATVITAPFFGWMALGGFLIVAVIVAGLSANERERDFMAARKAQIPPDR